MKRILFILSLILFCFFSGRIFSQQTKIDSLITKLKTLKNDTSKIGTLKNLSYLYYGMSNFIESKQYAEEILTITSQSKQTLAVKRVSAVAHSLIGAIYRKQGFFPEALKSQLAALQIREELNDKEGIADAYNNIGLIYERQNELEEALKNHQKAFEIYSEIKTDLGLTTSYNNLGVIYDKLGRYQDALKNFLASQKISKKMDDKEGVAMAFGNIGYIYQKQTDYKEALRNYFAAEKIFEELGDKGSLSFCYINIGQVYGKLKNATEANSYFDKSISLAKEIGLKDAFKEIYANLTELDSMKANWKGAYENHKLFILYRDSLNNEENTKKTVEAQMQYEFKRKEILNKVEQDAKDEIALKEKQKQNIVIYSVSCGMILVLALALFIFRSYRQKQKANIIITQQKIEVEKSKELIEHQKEMVEEKQKEVMDSINYAKRIQYSLLAQSDFLKSNLPDHFVYFNPKDIVSGDFYWAAKNEGRFYLAVCDSTGHGVPGAFMCILNIGFLSEAINEKGIVEPNEVLNFVRKRLITSISKEGQKDGFDGILICVDSKTKKITYSGANNAPILISDNKATQLDADRMPVGMGERKEDFKLHSIDYKKGDTLYLYTDGYADQFGGPKGKKLMYKRLNDSLIESHVLPLEDQLDFMKSNFEAWRGDLEQVDDVCLIGIKL